MTQFFDMLRAASASDATSAGTIFIQHGPHAVKRFQQNLHAAFIHPMGEERWPVNAERKNILRSTRKFIASTLESLDEQSERYSMSVRRTSVSMSAEEIMRPSLSGAVLQATRAFSQEIVDSEAEMWGPVSSPLYAAGGGCATSPEGDEVRGTHGAATLVPVSLLGLSSGARPSTTNLPPPSNVELSLMASSPFRQHTGDTFNPIVKKDV